MHVIDAVVVPRYNVSLMSSKLHQLGRVLAGGQVHLHAERIVGMLPDQDVILVGYQAWGAEVVEVIVVGRGARPGWDHRGKQKTVSPDVVFGPEVAAQREWRRRGFETREFSKDFVALIAHGPCPRCALSDCKPLVVSGIEIIAVIAS